MKSFKTLLLSFALMLVSTVAFGQSKINWKEQKDFHGVMSQTFHPAEEGNLQPIKMRSAEMKAKAEAWRKSEIPADVQDKKAVKKSLNKLCKEAGKLNKSVKKGASDAELTAQLTGMHDTFHTIVGLCNPKDEHEGHGH